MFTRNNTRRDRVLLLDSLVTESDPVTEALEEYCARSSRQLHWNPPDDEYQQSHSVFDYPSEEEEPPPLPCITFSRSQVLLHNLRVLGYDLSHVAANDNDQDRLATALEVALCHKRGLFWVEDIADALGLSVDAVRTAANDLHLAARTR